MKFTTFQEYLHENVTFTYGCVMAFTNHFEEFLNAQSIIKDSDLHEGGLENEPHVTLLYGLHSKEINKNDIFEGVKKIGLEHLRIKGFNIFEGENFDVLYFEVEVDEKLLKAHNFLKTFPYTNKFKDYKPHMTIAYLKPGLGRDYMKMLENAEVNKQIEISRFVYSLPSGAKLDFK